VIPGRFANQVVRHDKAPGIKELLTAAGVGLGFLLVGAHLMQAKANWGMVTTIAGLIGLCIFVRGVVSRFSERFVTSGLPLILVLCAGTWYFNNAAEIDLGRQDALKHAKAKATEDEQIFVEKIRQARTSWTPEQGVNEFAVAGTVVGWLAVAPKVQVDTEYEADLGPKAERLVPIRIVMLNNSYRDPDLPSTGNDSIWRLEVRDTSVQIISQWRVDVGLGDHVLGPAERREFQIPWDGRTTSGNLAGPGRYSVSLQPEATGSSASTKATIEIEDAGPIVSMQQSDIDRDLASQQDTMRMMSDSIRMQQTLRNPTANLQSLRSY
jgi:hypothetical protein